MEAYHISGVSSLSHTALTFIEERADETSERSSS